MWWQKYVGKKFEDCARGPDKFDCWGLVQCVYEKDHQKKIKLPGYDGLYKKTTDYETLGLISLEEREKHWKEVKIPQEFDVVLMRIRGVPVHVGIVTKKGFMIHCALGAGTVHERYDGLRWANRIVGFFRYE